MAGVAGIKKAEVLEEDKQEAEVKGVAPHPQQLVALEEALEKGYFLKDTKADSRCRLGGRRLRES